MMLVKNRAASACMDLVTVSPMASHREASQVDHLDGAALPIVDAVRQWAEPTTQRRRRRDRRWDDYERSSPFGPPALAAARRSTTARRS
jgi:hypothetical protein